VQPKPLIFIGSSSEGQHLAKLLHEILADGKYKVLGWWEPGVFAEGEYFTESLRRQLADCKSGLFVATPDDLTLIRGRKEWTARGNIILEYGMFSAVHGRHRVTLAITDDVELPSDLDGLNHLRLAMPEGLLCPDDSAGSRAKKFKQLNEKKVLDWADRVGRAPIDPAHELFDFFPRVADVLVDAVRRMKDKTDESIQHRDLDLMASDILGAIAAAVDTSNYGITDSLIEKISKSILRDCNAIYAVDVLGPRGWISPKTYRYLAPQIRHYIQMNTDDRGTWHILVSEMLGKALEQAIGNATAKVALTESGTSFDNPEDLAWEKAANPRMELSRILLWSKRELRSPIAEAVIAIHQAFHVPLFYLERLEDHSDRKVDYILFGVSDRIDGFFGLRTGGYATQDIKDSRIPGLGNPFRLYQQLLNSEDLLLARDARYIALNDGG